MHKKILNQFKKICGELNPTGSVLEVGAVPRDKSLLFMKCLENAKERVGLNLDGPHQFNGIPILQGNANHMEQFKDGQFDLVLCNAMLEHDKFFWKSISEMKRVTRPGGTIIIGVPGYTQLKFEKWKTFLPKIPIIRKLKSHEKWNALYTATLTFQIHDHPGDYYRFSPQTFRDVFFEGMEKVKLVELMIPPRIIGMGVKKLSN